MGFLSRKEQEILITSFERDYGKLVMQSNNKMDYIKFKNCLDQLVEQIESMANSKYFEDDNVDFLSSMSRSIKADV